MEQRLNKEDIEALCQAYFDCQLTRLEEKELLTVLLNSPEHSSPLICEAREMLSLETLAATCPRPVVEKARTPWHWWAAASVAILLGIGCWLMFEGRPRVEPQPKLAEVKEPVIQEAIAPVEVDEPVVKEERVAVVATPKPCAPKPKKRVEETVVEDVAEEEPIEMERYEPPVFDGSFEQVAQSARQRGERLMSRMMAQNDMTMD